MSRPHQQGYYVPETTRYSASSELGLDSSFDLEPHHTSSRASADAILGARHDGDGILTDSDDESGDGHPMELASSLRRNHEGEDSGEDSMQIDDGIEREDGQGADEDAASDSSFSDSLSSSPSIPSSDDIDFSLVYALHTFLATVDGQASVVKGDRLTLLDDSNSYWWLIRVLKTQAVGYIPAENIETPFERLARLNKHRNVDLSSATNHDHISGPTSSLAKTRFSKRLAVNSQRVRSPAETQSQRRGPLPPAQPGPGPFAPPTIAQNPGVGKGKNVAFAAPTYWENSGNEWSSDEEDEEASMEEVDGAEGEHEGGEEAESDSEGEWEGDRRTGAGQEGFDDDMDDEEETTSEIAPEPSASAARPQASALTGLASKASSESLSSKDDARTSLGRGPSPIQRAQIEQQQVGGTQTSPERPRRPSDAADPVVRSASGSGPNHAGNALQAAQGVQPAKAQPLQSTQPLQTAKKPLRPFDELVASGGSEATITKKLTLTPEIASDYSGAATASQRQRTASGSSTAESARSAGEKRHRDDLNDSVDGHASSPSIDSHAGSDDTHTSKTGKETGKKLKKERADDAGDGGKKRKGGGLLSGLFGRKKDKKGRKGGAEGDDDSSVGERASTDADRSDGTRSPASEGEGSLRGPSRPGSMQDLSARRPSDGDMFSTDAALRQQQIEAQEVLYRQFGIQQRQPGDQTNQLSLQNARPVAAAQSPQTPPSQNLSPTMSATVGTPAGRAPRPGSLIGSPAVPGFDVPVLNVLRLFAGDHIDGEATFKTVLLNDTTSGSDLVTQAMQRFHLPSGPADRIRYYLTIKDVSGEERVLKDDEKPLRVFEKLNDSLGKNDYSLPSVKRSSVGSISSISSNLSLNPAISRLGSGDFGDDSAVKLYINRIPQSVRRSWPKSLTDDAAADDSDTATITAPSPRDSQASLQAFNESASHSSPSQRFAMRIRIQPTDLPENLVFDPNTNAIVPRSVLQERGLRSPTEPGAPFREKIMFFPRNVNVSEAIEHALDAFGIPEGVVDGGDDVEDKVSKRRSVARVRYALAVQQQGKELLVTPNSKVLDAYPSAPAFRAADRSSREMKRRSLDVAFSLGTAADIQPSDPVFVLRKAQGRSRDSVRGSGLAGAVADELVKQQRHGRASSQKGSSWSSPAEQVSSTKTSAVTLSDKEKIAAQRAAFLSANRNTQEGTDITLANQTRLRSVRQPSDGLMHYSYIDRAGAETDISNLVEAEWSVADRRIAPSAAASTSQVSLSSVGDEGYISAPESPIRSERTYTGSSYGESPEDEEVIETLRATPLSIDEPTAAPPRSSSRASQASTSSQNRDVLAAALESSAHGAGPYGNDSFGKRIDRVISQVEGESTRRPIDGPARGNSRKDNNSVDSRSGALLHSRNMSNASQNSSRSSGTTSPATPMTAASPTAESNYTPLSSAARHGMESRQSDHRPPFVYRDDFGLDILMNIVEHATSVAAAERKARPIPDSTSPVVNGILGPPSYLPMATEGVRSWYSDVESKLSGIETQLDGLLAEVLRTPLA